MEITYFDRETKESKKYDFEIPQDWDEGTIYYYFNEGNGSCDCNRGLEFYCDSIVDHEPKCGNRRFIITHVDGKEIAF